MMKWSWLCKHKHKHNINQERMPKIECKNIFHRAEKNNPKNIQYKANNNPKKNKNNTKPSK